MTAQATFSHLGICVADLDRAHRFYREGLGLEEVARHEVGEQFAALMELDGVSLTSVMLRRGGLTVELLGFAHPRPVGTAERRPLNQLGLTHLSFRVDDLEAVATRLVALGGVLVESSRTPLPMGEVTLDFVYLTDPDGTRIELMQLPGD